MKPDTTCIRKVILINCLLADVHPPLLITLLQCNFQFKEQ